MKILVTGAAGFLGSAVVERLLRNGHGVRAIIRPASAEPAWSGNIEIVRADLRVSNNLVAAFDGIDAIIHLAAAVSGDEDSQFTSTVIGTERLLAAMAQSTVRRFVHISSLVVYDWRRVIGTMDEDSPLVSDVYPMGGYAIAKVWQERIVSKAAKEHGWELTVLRPGFVWGPQHAEIAGMGRRFGRAYVMFGPSTRLPLTYVDNCADAIVAALENPGAVGKVFNVVDDDDVRVRQYVREFARRSGQRGLMLPLPYFFGLGLAKLATLVSHMLFGKRGKLPSLLMPRRFESQFKPVRFSNRRLRDVLHWNPPLSFEQSLDATYK